MTLSFTPFATDDVVDASDLGSVFSDIEDFVNTGIGTDEIQDSEFVKTQHIYKPDFMLSPAPRFRSETGETHWRLAGLDRVDRVTLHPDLNVGQFINVPGMFATIKVPQDCRACVYAACYAYEVGGEASDNDVENTSIAEMALFVGTSKQDGTTRHIYPGQVTGTEVLMARKNHSWATQLNSKLSAGIVNIGFRIKIADAAAEPPSGESEIRAKHIFIRERVMVVDLFMR